MNVEKLTILFNNSQIYFYFKRKNKNNIIQNSN